MPGYESEDGLFRIVAPKEMSDKELTTAVEGYKATGMSPRGVVVSPAGRDSKGKPDASIPPSLGSTGGLYDAYYRGVSPLTRGIDALQNLGTAKPLGTGMSPAEGLGRMGLPPGLGDLSEEALGMQPGSLQQGGQQALGAVTGMARDTVSDPAMMAATVATGALGRVASPFIPLASTWARRAWDFIGVPLAQTVVYGAVRSGDPSSNINKNMAESGSFLGLALGFNLAFKSLDMYFNGSLPEQAKEEMTAKLQAIGEKYGAKGSLLANAKAYGEEVSQVLSSYSKQALKSSNDELITFVKVHAPEHEGRVQLALANMQSSLSKMLESPFNSKEFIAARDLFHQQATNLSEIALTAQKGLPLGAPSQAVIADNLARDPGFLKNLAISGRLSPTDIKDISAVINGQSNSFSAISRILLKKDSNGVPLFMQDPAFKHYVSDATTRALGWQQKLAQGGADAITLINKEALDNWHQTITKQTKDAINVAQANDFMRDVLDSLADSNLDPNKVKQLSLAKAKEYAAKGGLVEEAIQAVYNTQSSNLAGLTMKASSVPPIMGFKSGAVNMLKALPRYTASKNLPYLSKSRIAPTSSGILNTEVLKQIRESE